MRFGRRRATQLVPACGQRRHRPSLTGFPNPATVRTLLFRSTFGLATEPLPPAIAAMASALHQPLRQAPAKVWGHLPSRLRILFVTTAKRPGGWLAEAFAADSAAEVQLEEVCGVAAGLARLRDDLYDAVLISHQPGQLDALDLAEALRTGGSEEPLVILGKANDPDLAALSYEVGADAYLCIDATTTRTLLWTVARAIERHQLLREHRRLTQAERQRLQHEHAEAERLLIEQRALVGDLESLCQRNTTIAADRTNAAPYPAASAADSACVAPLPANLVVLYRDLLRTYVVMGSGNLSGELGHLADLLATAGVSAQQVMLMHLQVLEALVRGLGNRSARHVMARADLLVLELMLHLAEGYRQRYFERKEPPVQRLLPGFSGSVSLPSAAAASEAASTSPSGG
jgi:DNA-binding response OmpR family regulator